MGTYVIRVPDIGEGIAEVELVAWHVQPGDAVSEDQHLADVMTPITRGGSAQSTRPARSSAAFRASSFAFLLASASM